VTDHTVETWIQTHLFEQIPQGLVIIDREHRIVRANQRLREAFGDWSDRRCFDVLKGRSSRCEGCEAARVFADGVSRTTVEVWIDRDGRHGHYVVRLVPVPEPDGSIGHVMKMATDVTEAETLQWEHQILFERVPCYVAVLDRQLHVVRANELLRTTFGDHNGKHCHEVYKNSAERCPDCPALRSFVDGKVHTQESTGTRRDGREARYVVTTAPLARSGEPIEYVIEILHDVTDLVQLEEELVRERQFLRSVVDHSFDGIVATDAGGRVAIVNPAAEKLLGLLADELRGTSDLARVYPSAFLSVLDSRGTSCILPETTISARGEEVPIRFSGVVLREAERVLGSAGFLQDLRDIKRLEREKLDAERLAAVGQTVAGLAHGVKNILTGLEGGMFLVSWGLEDDRRDKIQQGWEMLDRNFHKITTFVREFLSFAKGREAVVAPTDPNRVAEDAATLFREAAREKGVQVVTELSPDVSEANLDADGIHACLANLLSNAIDACLLSDQGGGTVTLRTRERAGVLEFEVEDNGCGMDCEIKSKVFTSFFTTKGTAGTGLGLLVTKKVVQEHGGSVDIESSPGVGSTFRITLPRARLPEPRAEELDQGGTAA
jgi:PAS domain S-box-containing protein